MTSADFYWDVVKLFYNPPGTPPDLRCINCKYTLAGIAFLAGTGSSYGLFKTIRTKPYSGSALGIVSFFMFASSAVLVRLAKEDEKFNRFKIRDHARQLRRERRERSGLPPLED